MKNFNYMYLHCLSYTKWRKMKIGFYASSTLFSTSRVHAPLQNNTWFVWIFLLSSLAQGRQHTLGNRSDKPRPPIGPRLRVQIIPDPQPHAKKWAQDWHSLRPSQPVLLLGTNNSTRRTLWAPHLSSVVWTMVAGAPEQEGTQRRSVGGPPRQPGQRDLTGASMVEETVAEWPVPTSDENLNQPPLGLAVLTVCNQWRCGGDYPGMLRHTDSKQHSEKW